MPTNKKAMLEYIKTFINSASRNHLVLASGCIQPFRYVDVGSELSASVEPIISDRRLSMRTQDNLHSILREGLQPSDEVGPYLALTNIGILFEPLLKIDIERVFDRWSQNSLLLIDIGKGIVSQQRLFLVKDCPKQYSVSLQSLNYIII